MDPATRTIDPLQRRAGAPMGMFVGDALAMPVHWYYDRRALARDYGYVTDYLPPRNPHPDSILWRSSYRPSGPKGDILHEQARFWGRSGIHYHQFLQAGENTLNLKLSALLIESLNQQRAYRAGAYLQDYIRYMTTPGNHSDTYVEEYHRRFFANYAAGSPPTACGVTEKHVSGIIGMIPVAVFYADTPPAARAKAFEHLHLTHLGPRMDAAGAFLLDVLLPVLGGAPLGQVLTDLLRRQANPLLGHPLEKWLKHPDDVVIGRRLSPACYVEDAIPAIAYLALKYATDLEQALVVNTNLGGDNAGRGAVLGALLGAANGLAAIPPRWQTGLLQPPPTLSAPPPMDAA
jgi:ADP-ribosylglycohydrolase